MDLHLSAKRQRSRLQRPVYFRRGREDRFHGKRPHHDLQRSRGRNHIDQLAALCQHHADSYPVFIPEGLPDGVDIIQRQLGHPQGIDPFVRRKSRMGRLAGEAHDLRHKAVAVGVHGAAFSFRHLHHVVLEKQICPIQFPPPDKLLLPAIELDLTLFDQAVPVIIVNTFFCRHRQEFYIPAQFFQRSGFLQAQGAAKQIGDLHIVTAGMDVPARLTVRMIRAQDAVQFSQHAHRRAVLSPGRSPAAGVGKILFHCEPCTCKGFFCLFLCLELLISQFRRLVDRLPQFYDLLFVPVDRSQAFFF